MAQPVYRDPELAQAALDYNGYSNPTNANMANAPPGSDYVADATSGAHGTSALDQLKAVGVNVDPLARTEQPTKPTKAQEYDPSMGPILGVGLPGSVITPNEKQNENVVGERHLEKNIVGGGGPAAPSALRTNQSELDESDKRLNEQLDKQIQSVDEEKKALTAGIEEHSKLLGDAEKKRISAELESKQRLDSFYAETKTKNEADEIENENLRKQKIDPQHWFKEKGTAGTIAAAIAMGMGAFGASITKSPNYASDIINKAIDRDVNAQEDNIKNEWKAHSSKVDAHSKEYVQGQYINQKKDEAYLRSYSHAIFLADNAKINANDQAAVIGKEGIKTELVGKREEVIQRIANRKLSVWIKEHPPGENLANDYKAYAIKTTSAGEPTLSFEQFVQRIHGGQGGGATKYDAKDQEKVVNIGGQNYIGNSSKQAEEAKTAVDSAREVIKLNGRINTILADVPYANSPKGRAELNALLDQGALHYPRMQTGSTRINETEIKMGQGTYTGKGDIFRGDMLGKTGIRLQTITRQAEGRIKDAMGGLTPVGAKPKEEEQKTPDFSGKVIKK